MKSPVVKNSIVVAGHKTSVSLEEAFWSGLKEISALRNTTLSSNSSARSTARASRVICRRPSASMCWTSSEPAVIWLLRPNLHAAAPLQRMPTAKLASGFQDCKTSLRKYLSAAPHFPAQMLKVNSCASGLCPRHRNNPFRYFDCVRNHISTFHA